MFIKHQEEVIVLNEVIIDDQDQARKITNFSMKNDLKDSYCLLKYVTKELENFLLHTKRANSF